MPWDRLRAALAELAARDPRPLMMWPGAAADHPLPARVTLAPWATDAAAQLHERFGDEVVLTVGLLAYPSGELVDFHGTVHAPPGPSDDPVLDPADLAATVTAPLEVRTGHAVHAALEVANHRPSPVVISTTGSLFGRVLDPSTGDVVGGFSGAITTPLVQFTVAPGGTVAVPLVVGTASYRGSLGYAVPPGDWAVEVVLRLGEGDRRVPPLQIRVVE